MAFDLDPQAEKQAKKYANTGTRQTNGAKTERKRKENPTKATIISEIAQFLTENGYEMVETLAKRSDDTFALKEGTLYPILKKLENGGYLK